VNFLGDLGDNLFYMREILHWCYSRRKFETNKCQHQNGALLKMDIAVVIFLVVVRISCNYFTSHPRINSVYFTTEMCERIRDKKSSLKTGSVTER